MWLLILSYFRIMIVANKKYALLDAENRLSINFSNSKTDSIYFFTNLGFKFLPFKIQPALSILFFFIFLDNTFHSRFSHKLRRFHYPLVFDRNQHIHMSLYYYNHTLKQSFPFCSRSCCHSPCMNLTPYKL